MRVGDLLLFAPGVPFAKLDLDNPAETVAIFAARVEGFYLAPARALLENRDHAFACGLLCCTAIDFLARYSRDERDDEGRFAGWLSEHALGRNEEADALARRLYRDFRHGLVHEGRVKNGGQFSFDYGDRLIFCEDGVAIVNPALLLGAVSGAFRRDCDLLLSDARAYTRFVGQLRRDFRKELAFSRE